MNTATPPRWADVVLRLLLAPRDRQTVSGDLLEEYRETIHPARGRRRADLWYVSQVVGFAWRANRTWAGRLERLPTSVLAHGNRNVGEALCSVVNEGRELLPGINVNIRIQVSKLMNALVVARGAVRVEGTRRFVFAAQAGKLQKRQIRVGAANATRYEVLEGVGEGDWVALPGDVELKDGMPVRVAESQ